MFTIYTNNEVLELDTLAEALEECEFLQVESSGNAEIMLVDETGAELKSDRWLNKIVESFFLK